MARDHRRRRRIVGRHGGSRGLSRGDRRAPPVQQGQRRVGQERHPARGRRVRADRGRRRPASARRRPPPRRETRRVRPRHRRAIRRDPGDAGPARGKRRAELAGRLPHGPRDSRPDIGIPRRDGVGTPRIPAPAPERLLHADDDDAGVPQGGLQRDVRADPRPPAIGAVEDPPGARRREVPDDHLQDRHALQSAAHLPADQPAVVDRRRGLRHLERRRALAHSERVGAPHPVRGGRLPRRARVRADLGAAIRRTAVIAARRWIVACALVGLALRLGFALLYWVDQPLTHEEREYLAPARSVARGDGFTYPADEPSPGTAQQFGRAPGYPFFLAALGITEPSEHVPRRVQIAQAVVGAIGIWLMAAIAGRVAGPRAAVAAAAIAALHPPLVWIPAYALSETLYSTLALAAALALTEDGGWGLEVGGWRSEVGKHQRPHSQRAGAEVEAQVPRTTPRPTSNSQPPTSARIAAAAAVTAAAILVRPAMLFFVPLAALWMIWRRRATNAVVFVVVAALCVLPWTIRNHRVYGRWIAVASEGGVTFWTGNHPLAVGEGDLAANPDLKRAELAFRAAHPGLTPEQLEPLYYRDALAWIRREPRAWLSLMTRKVFYTIVPLGPSYAIHSARYFVASVASYLLVLPAAAAGAWRWRIMRRGGAPAGNPAALWLMAAATVAAELVFFPQERFRIPIIDPALIVTTALLFAGFRTHGRTGRHADI